MNEYDFILRFALQKDAKTDEIESLLFEQGCDDALVGLGQRGRLGLSFTRLSANAREAVVSAITDVKRAIPEARLMEVGPDLVGLSDIAEQLDFSRQNMRKLLQHHIASFPLPVHAGRSALWHLADVLDWFAAHQGRSLAESLQEVAKVSMQLNVYREARRFKDNKPAIEDALLE